MTRARTSLRTAGSALAASARDRDLRAAQSSFALAWLAEWAATVGVGVLAYRHGGALAVGLVGLARSLPAAVVGPLAASLADVGRRERVLVAVSLARAALFAAVGGFVALEQPWPSYLLLVLAGSAGVLFRPVHSALLPSLCRSAHDLAAATAARGLLDSVAVFLGPLLATVLLGLGQLAGVFAAAAALSGLAGLCVVRLGYEAPPREAPPVRASRRGRAGAGLAAVAADPGLRVMFGLAAAQTLVRGGFTVFAVVLALDVLAAGEAAVGVLTTAVGVGAVLGSLGAMVLAGSRHLAVWFGVGVALWGLPLAATGAAPSVLVAAIVLTAVGVGNALLDLGIFTLPPRMVPDAVLARAFAVLEAVVAVSVGVGALLAPLLIEATGARAALVVYGLVPPVAVVAAWRALRRIDAAMRERDRQVAVLAAVPMLAPLPMPAIERLAARVQPRVFLPGTDVVRQGEAADGFHLLLEGTADVVHDGRVLRRLGPGDSFGEVALLRDTARTATVRATTGARTWMISREQFLSAVRGYTPSRTEADLLLSRLAFVPEQRSAPAGRPVVAAR